MPKHYECAWCTDPVTEKGATCDLICYRSWIWWHQHLLAKNPQLILIQPLEEVPLDLHDQPWYDVLVKSGPEEGL